MIPEFHVILWKKKIFCFEYFCGIFQNVSKALVAFKNIKPAEILREILAQFFIQMPFLCPVVHPMNAVKSNKQYLIVL